MIYRNKIERDNRQQLHLTAGKKGIKDFPKLPYFDWTQYKLATSFIHKTLAVILRERHFNCN
jgi:hypothetical protein